MKRTINKAEHNNKNLLKSNKIIKSAKSKKLAKETVIANEITNKKSQKNKIEKKEIKSNKNKINNQANLNLVENDEEDLVDLVDLNEFDYEDEDIDEDIDEDLGEPLELDGLDQLDQLDQNNSSNVNQQAQINLDEVFKIFEKIFNEQIQEELALRKKQAKEAPQNVIHIQTENVMEIFEYQLKKQLIEIMNNESNKKSDDNANSEEETIEKLNEILTSLENEPDFIKISDEEFKIGLELIPTQEDFDCFCAQMDYELKLTPIASEDYEKLYTIMYTIGNYCYEPKKNLKRIILSIIKFDLLRNKIVDNMQKTNREENNNYTFDCITADMLFMNLRHFVPKDLMKTISRNIAYYFSKIY